MAAPGGRAGSVARRGMVRAAGAAPAAAERVTRGRAGSLCRNGQMVDKLVKWCSMSGRNSKAVLGEARIAAPHRYHNNIITIIRRKLKSVFRKKADFSFLMKCCNEADT